MTSTLEGKLALVTGASRGVGATTAQTISEAGAEVVLVARSRKELEQVEGQIHDQGGHAILAPMDLCAGDHILGLADELMRRFGRLDILIHAAATLGPLSPVSHITDKDWDHVMALNARASFQIIRGFDPLLQASEEGKLIMVTSSVARKPRAYWGPYAASKAVLEMLALTYAEEQRNVSNLKVAILDPGATRTEMRAEAFPGEDPQQLKPPQAVARKLLEIILSDYESGSYFSC